MPSIGTKGRVFRVCTITAAIRRRLVPACGRIKHPMGIQRCMQTAPPPLSLSSFANPPQAGVDRGTNIDRFRKCARKRAHSWPLISLHGGREGTRSWNGSDQSNSTLASSCHVRVLGALSTGKAPAQTYLFDWSRCRMRSRSVGQDAHLLTPEGNHPMH